MEQVASAKECLEGFARDRLSLPLPRSPLIVRERWEALLLMPVAYARTHCAELRRRTGARIVDSAFRDDASEVDATVLPRTGKRNPRAPPR